MRFYKSIIFSASIKIILAAGTATNVIPGTVNAYNYDDYYDVSDGANSGPTIDGAKDVAYINDNEWLKYNVKNEKTSKYEISYVVSSNRAIPIDLELFLLIDPKETSKDQMCVSNVQSGKYLNDNFTSNDWKKYISLKSSNTFEISEGDHTIVMCIKKGEWTNIKAIEFKDVSTDDDEGNDPTTDDGDGDDDRQTSDNGYEVYNTIDWSTKNGQLMLNGNAFHLKGVNWYGFNNNERDLRGLDKRSMESLLDFLKENKFNAIRLPISVQMILNIETSVAQNCSPKFNDCSLSTKETLLKLFDEAAKRGIFILVDMHSRSDDNYLDPIWWGDDYSNDQFYTAWDRTLELLGDMPNLFGIDLFNEPHDEVNWGRTNDNYDWHLAATQLTEHIYYKFPKFDKFIMIEGIGYGKDYRDYDKTPLDFKYLSDDLDNRVIFGGHFYGPAVSPQLPNWYTPDFPNNLNADWDTYLGTLKKRSGRAYAIGETGGTLVDKDKAWMETFAKYLVDNCYEDVFYWALNPESKDTSGLLKDDYYTPETEKLAIYDTIQPNPSNVLAEIKSDYLKIDFGAYANNKCNI